MIAASGLPHSLTQGLRPRDVARLRAGLGRVASDPVAAAIALRGWTPHPAQARVLRALDVRRGAVKLAAICAGTGWGKSDVIAELHAEVAESGSRRACLMASRSQEQANLALKRLVVNLTTHPVSAALVDHVVASPFPTLHLKNGSYITARTTKDDCVALRGPEWDFITLDEAAFGDEFAWHFLTTRVRKSNGPVVCFSSPQEEWFEDLFREFEEAYGDGRRDVFAYTGPAQENPYLSEEFFERMRARLPDVLYRQEVLAEFVGSNVYSFRREHLARIFDDGLPATMPPVKGHRYGSGFDLGVESSSAVAVVLDATARELVSGAHMRTWPGASSTWPHLQRGVEEIVRAYPGRKSIDWTGVGNAAGQNLRVHVREDERFVFTGPTRYDLCVEAMKFVETSADLQRPVVSLVLPSSGPWGELRSQLRKHKLSTTKRKDSKSLGGAGGCSWDELDAFLLAVHAVKMLHARAGSLLEFV